MSSYVNLNTTSFMQEQFKNMSSEVYLERVIYGLPIGLGMFFLGCFFYFSYRKKNIKPLYGVKRENLLGYLSDAAKILAYHYCLALMFIGGVIVLMAIVFLILSFVK